MFPTNSLRYNPVQYHNISTDQCDIQHNHSPQLNQRVAYLHPQPRDGNSHRTESVTAPIPPPLPPSAPLGGGRVEGLARGSGKRGPRAAASVRPAVSLSRGSDRAPSGPASVRRPQAPATGGVPGRSAFADAVRPSWCAASTGTNHPRPAWRICSGNCTESGSARPRWPT